MFSKVQTITMKGLSPCFVEAEADISPGLPIFEMIGYLSSEVKEARERVRTALKNAEISLPTGHITVNLAPAGLRKQGTGFDLAVALSILLAMNKLPVSSLENALVIGELGLDGQINGVHGVLPMVMAAKEAGIRRCILPKANEAEGGLIPEMEILAAHHLQELLTVLRKAPGHKAYVFNKKKQDLRKIKTAESSLDFADIQGQESMKRATVIAAAGLHNILYIGPPGVGKTMMARRIPTILPTLTWEESLEVTKIYSISGLLSAEKPMITTPPFRAPHHTISRQALAGGGRHPKPGEISLSHLGVLFLDELPEFSKATLEILRQPLEEKEIRLSRSEGTYIYPAGFMLAAAMNPCSCGYYPDRRKCQCSMTQINRYLGKISQPLLDRIDLCTEAPAVAYEELRSNKRGISSAEMKAMVQSAVERQRKRYQKTKLHFNSDLTSENIRDFCPVSSEGEKLMKTAYEKMELTARAYHRIMKTARTIADLDGEEIIQKEHLSEAIYYRSLDKKYWKG